MFLNLFYPVEFSQAKKPTLEGGVWTGRLNLSSLSLFSFAELKKALQTQAKGTDEEFWFSFQKNHKFCPTYPRLAIFFWQSNTLRESHQTSRSTLRAETSSLFQYDPPENQIWHTNDIFSHRRRKRLSLSDGPLFRSELSDRRHNTGFGLGFGDKSIVSLHFPRKVRAGQQGLLSINFDFRNVTFQPTVFPFVWQSTNENLWEIVASSPFLPPRVFAAARAFSRCSLRSPKWESLLAGYYCGRTLTRPRLFKLWIALSTG